ncbi:hypothetical protein [Novipirellula sp.]|uniref:hypothetical protein n=1 Tax=Novipirellula sp. TaxID=2795430 RepID=UPI0035661D1A
MQPSLREVFGESTESCWDGIATDYRNENGIGQRQRTSHDVAEEANLGVGEIVLRHPHHAFVMEDGINHQCLGHVTVKTSVFAVNEDNDFD